MKPSFLRRETPLKRNNIPRLRRTKLKPMSDKRRRESVVYGKLRKAFLEEHPVCQVMFGSLCTGESTEVHHRDGRYGKNLLNVESWWALCAPCHRFLHDHPSLARKLGLLSPR